MEPNRYAALYLAPLVSRRRVRRASTGAPLLELRHCHLAHGETESPPLPLTQLFTAGVECGHFEARAELKRRIVTVDESLDDLRAVRDRAQSDSERLAADLVATQRKYFNLQDETQRQLETMQTEWYNLQDELAGVQQRFYSHVAQLESEVQSARGRIAEIEGSTMWRMTKPARASLHALKVWSARSRARWLGLKRLPQMATTAASIARNEGPTALAQRVTRKLTGGERFRPTRSPGFRQEDTIAPLAFTPGARPRVSIVIPVYGKPLLTFTCLKSVHANTPAGTYEVIVMDDCSPESMAEALSDVSGVRFERNPENLGFLRTVNRGAEFANGEFLVILNNDTIVTPGWLDGLLSVFRAHPEAGLVGAKLIYPDGRLQEAGGIVWRDGSAWNLGRNDDPDRPEFNYLREADYCSGACLAIPTALFRELEGFDLRFAPAYYEDTDLAFAVRAAGRKVFYQPLSTVVQFEGQTSGTDETGGVKQHQIVNRKTFEEKWRAELASHRGNGIEPELERDRGARVRVLVIDACMLTPDQDSGSVRMQAILEILVSLKCKVTFVADNLEHRQPYVTMLQQAGVEVLFYPYVKSIAQLLDTRGSEFDIIVMSRHYIAVKHIDAARAFAPKALLVFDTVDLHFLREERLAELEGKPNGIASARAKREEELALIRKADVTLVVSPTESALLSEIAPEAQVMVLSNIHEPLPGGKAFAEREGLVFIGGFQHPPNADAVLWYAREILPRVRERVPGAKTYIVGSKVPPTIRVMATDDFVVTGFVPDVTPYFTGCRISIAPLRYGAGVKGKINLAMSYGLPVVATTPSIEGMHLTDGEDVLVADTPEAFADAIARLYRDEALWQRLAAGGLENVRAHFSRDVARSAITRIIALTRDKRVPATAEARVSV